MRLLTYNDDGQLCMTRDFVDKTPRYAILSHTWDAVEEVTYQEFQHNLDKKKLGYKKIQFCGEQARRDGLTHFWVDTCCIDETNSVEVSEAITSMFRWYQNAEKCYVYLTDISTRKRSYSGDLVWKTSIRENRWFTRGWTLQELLAPRIVEFYSCKGDLLGTKETLIKQIHEITTIPIAALEGTPPSQFSIAERIRWAEGRSTTKKEDQAYCLLGIFDVFMPLIYGKGENALRRLQKEIDNRHGANVAAGLLTRDLISNSSGSVRPRDQIRPQVNNTDKYNVLLKSLLFDRINFRVNNVQKALLSTCEWLFHHPDFQRWYANATPNAHNGFMWIKGKPGCGKSTLMKAALEWARNKETETPVRQTIVPYFFNARASASLEKSALGLYRTLVHHLLRSYDFLQPLFMNKFVLKNVASSREEWTVEELQEFLYDSVESGNSFVLCLFIDALDEAEHENDVRQMISFLVQLADRASAANGSCQLKICLSSRHYPHISIGRVLSLVVEDVPEHDQDIATYIAKQLRCTDGPEKDRLRSRILTKSARIFFWVVLVVEELNQLDDYGAPLSDMQARLEAIPAGLNELFRDILLKSDYGFETSLLFFQWMVFSMRTLEPAELFVAMEYSRSPNDMAWAPPSTALLPPHDRLLRYILNCSRGLVEVVEVAPGKARVVQFIHETVREFLLKDNGLALIVPALATNLIGVSHEVMRIACQRCTSQHQVSNRYRPYCNVRHESKSALATFKSKMRLKLPFLDYAISYLFEHAEQAQRHDISQQAFLKAQMDEDDVLSNSYRHWWNVLEQYKSKKIGSSVTLLYFVVEREYPSLTRELLNMSNINGRFGDVLQLASYKGDLQLVQSLLKKGVDFGIPGRKYNTALYTASQQGYFKIVQTLLDSGIDPNSRGGNFGRAITLHTASARGHVEIVQLLLDRGANINATGEYRGTALYAASIEGRIEVVRLLLDRGAHINTEGGNHGTALQAASCCGHLEVVRLLLDRGAHINTEGGNHGTALQAASAGNHLEIVKLLQDFGAST